MATIATFRERFPEFSVESDTRVQLFLDDAELLMASPDKWLAYYDTAHAYYAAHFLYCALQTEMGDGGVLAPIKKQEVDDVMVEQAVTALAANASDLQSTAYGKRYVNYRRLIAAGPLGV
tara:strand:- start:366 stop:725 length:360 start_codon:yes stop_codon:yes gene_type:complete